ncbi:MAG: shikimate kinase [Ruminococcaceae bacterium]|nr:shikimate kinase [Oscillospiraceae bacterium]
MEYKRIVLIGMPCSGKSSIGRVIAKYLKCRFIDMDEMIEERVGMPIPEIFEKYGEEKFRQLECILAQSLAKTQNVVISTGGGIVTRPNAIEPLACEDSYVIFLFRSFYKLVGTPERVMEKRPLLKERSASEFHAMYKERMPLYRKYATVEINNETEREESVNEIMNKLREVGINFKNKR